LSQPSTAYLFEIIKKYIFRLTVNGANVNEAKRAGNFYGLLGNRIILLTF
jgi:hypothetical protein